jgi:hypothetical protein
MNPTTPFMGNCSATSGNSSPDALAASIAFRRDGRVLATALTGGTAKLWNMATLQPSATLVPLPEGGCRFAPGELDPYVPEIRRLPADAPIIPA